MGFSISWIAVQGKSKAAVLAELGLRETGKCEAVSDWPVAGVQLSERWYLLFLNDVLHPYTEHATLSTLSNGCIVIACQAEEHVMASAVYAYQDGVKQWDVTHEAEKGPSHLSEHGQLPFTYASVKESLLEKQKSGDAANEGVDYVWEIPVTLAYEVVGFRHDSAKLKNGGEAAFCELVAAR